MTLENFVKLGIEFILFRACADKFRLIDRLKACALIGWFVTFEIDGALYSSREQNKHT